MVADLRPERHSGLREHEELQEIVRGDKSGRISNDEITYWKTVVLAIEDTAITKVVFDKAVKEGLEKEVEL